MLELIFHYAPRVSLFPIKLTCKKWKPFVEKNIPNYLQILILSGDVHLIKWAISQGCVFDLYDARMIQGDAIAKGKIEVLETIYSIKGNIELQRGQFAEIAAKNNQLEILKWLVEKKYQITGEALFSAACFEHSELVEWILNYWKCVDEDMSPRVVVFNARCYEIWIQSAIDLGPSKNNVSECLYSNRKFFKDVQRGYALPK